MDSDKVTREKGPVEAGYEFRMPSKKTILWLMAALTIYVFVRGVVGAREKPFWYDELLTLAIAGQPTLHEMWNAAARGFDGMPPAFYLVERAALGVARSKEIAQRLPSLLAFCCTLICVFAYVKKRSGEAVACLCALLLLTTSLFHTYLIDARACSMVMAGMSPNWSVNAGAKIDRYAG